MENLAKQLFKVVPDTIVAVGGAPIRERVGHAHIKKTMREHQAIFGGEVSGHYYFKDNQFMDNGMIPALLVLEILSQSGKTLSETISALGDYYVSGEINSDVKNKQAVLDQLKDTYQDGQQDFLDGISVDYPDWRFNVRPSGTEDVIRLNLEANSLSLMKKKRDEVLAIIRG
jgi:phosphomannomutase